VQKKAVEVEEDGAGMDSASDEDDRPAVRSGQHSPVKDNGPINYKDTKAKCHHLKKLTCKVKVSHIGM
jgi:hypothetical protein